MTSVNIDEILMVYTEIARPVMRRYMSPNSCVSATRVTIECLERFGIAARPQAVKWLVSLPARELCYASGLTEAERATAKQSVYHDWNTENPWNGHLIALTDEWLIDSSFDQALIALGGKPEDVILTLKIPEPRFGSIDCEGLTDEQETIRIQYVATDDCEWKSSEAWLDPQIPFIVSEICRSSLFPDGNHRCR